LNNFNTSGNNVYLHTFLKKLFLMKLFLTVTLALLIVPVLHSQSRDQLYLDYIEQYHRIATAQQRSHGIPASIILAQGLLESGAGRSRLAAEGNNHFGIKCHEWTGQRIFHDDDERNECFRKYRHARESFEDHSIFLTSRPRYQSLFALPPNDYKGWAHGLRAAGYATDPQYANKLISLIERYELYRYDQQSSGTRIDREELRSPEPTTAMLRPTYRSNGLKFVVARQGDSFTTIAAETGIREDRLRFFNDVPEHATLQPGAVIYLTRKKRKGSRVYPVHVVQAGETLYGISQTYGIRLIELYKLNELNLDQGARIGQIIHLR
jgi:hypothetical protein